MFQSRHFAALLCLMLLSGTPSAQQLLNVPDCQILEILNPISVAGNQTEGPSNTGVRTLGQISCAGNRMTVETGPSKPDGSSTTIRFPLQITSEVDSEQRIFGLASYLEISTVVLSSSGRFSEMETDETVALDPNRTLGLSGRYQALLMRINQPISVAIESDYLSISYQQQPSTLIEFWYGRKSDAQEFSPDSTLLYWGLWQSLASLAGLVERLLMTIAGILGSYGWAIIVLAGIVKLAFLPLSLLGKKLQTRVDALESEIQPRLKEIKRQFDGEEAHNRIMAVYKSYGVTPFHTMKPLLVTLLVIPVFVAVFNVLGELPELAGLPFWWISDLAYPDAVIGLPFAVPAMGNSINLLVFVMTGASILATIASKRANPDATQRGRQILQLSVMSAAFFFLFYPFPSSMVLYWASTNLIAAGASLAGEVIRGRKHQNNLTSG